MGTRVRLRAFVVSLLFLCLFVGIPVRRITAQATPFDTFKADLAYVRAQSEAALLFTPFGSNNDGAFAKHKLTEEQVLSLCDGGKDCGTLGVNFGTYFKKGDYLKIREKFGMKWALEIGEASHPSNAADAINEPTKPTVIIRIGIRESSGGFQSLEAGGAKDYIAFLQSVASRVGGKTFYAIAGPNEPDIEPWVAPDCKAAPGTASAESETFYKCVGKPLAAYMNAVCAAKASGELPANVKLLSPAFNMSSYTFPGIVKAMDAAGANWGCVDAIAGNLYPAGKSMQAYWNDENTGATIKFFQEKGKGIIVTETGPWEQLDQSSGNMTQADRKAEEFYITPIKGIGTTSTLPVIRTDLIKQGYEARCATPGFKIALSNADVTAVKNYLLEQNNPSGAVLGGIGIDGAPDKLDNYGKSLPINNRMKSTLSIDYRDALIPVMRDLTRIPQLKQSLESYFGYSQSAEKSYSEAELKSAPVNSLLTQQERCTQSVISLLQRDIMCKKLANPSACALYSTAVPGSSYTVKSLLEEYQKSAGISSDLFKNCGEIVAKKGILKDALLTLPLQIEHAYRLAFLVTTIDTQIQKAHRMMRLFQHPKRGILDVGPDPTQLVMVNAFKVPDFTTNKGTIPSEGDSGDTTFNDPSLLTRDLLISTSTKKNYDEKGIEQRKKLLDIANTQVADKTQDVPPMMIQCGIGSVGSPQCYDPLSRAVIDIVNAQAIADATQLKCDDYQFEAPQAIFDSADLHSLPNVGRVFSQDFGVALLENLFTDETHIRPLTLEYDPTYADTNSKKTGAVQFDWGLKSVFYVIKGTENLPYSAQDARKVNHYIVYPEGYDLKTVEAVVSGSFFSTEQLKALQDKAKSFEFLSIANQATTFEGGQTSHTYTDKSKPVECGKTDIIDATGTITGQETKYCYEDRTISFGMEAEPTPKTSGILGGKLGYWLYTVQMALSKADALTHKYLENCKSVEDFLLDHCGGESVSQTAALNPIYSCSIYNSATVDTTQIATFTVQQKNGSNLKPSDFIASAGEKGCSVKADTRIVDAVSLILSDGKQIVANNPGNKLSACASPQDVTKSLTIYKWTEGGKPGVNDPQWEKMPKLVSGSTQAASRMMANISLKTGYYKLKVDFYGTLGEICLGPARVLSAPNAISEDTGFILDFTSPSCPRDTCFTTTVQPAMQGGDTTTTDVNGCSLGFDYPISYNTACGGGRGGDCGDFDGCDTWRGLIAKFRTDHATGVSAYEKTFNKSLQAPASSFTCTSTSNGRQPLFPSTSIKTSCASFNSGSSALDSIALFGTDLSFSIPYWSGVETPFTVPSKELWTAITDASKKHGCDPLLVLAVAHSESRSYTNHTVPNEFGAVGVFQFTPGSWGLWKQANATGVGICSIHQPPTFSTTGLDFSSPANIPAAADSACRLVLWTGMQKYQTDQRNFVRAFAQRGDNGFGQIWNRHQPQADYVWRLWNKLLEVTKQTPREQPAGYPYGPC